MKIKESQLRQIIKESIQELNNSNIDNNIDITSQINYMSERLQRLSQELQYGGRMINNILQETITTIDNLFQTKVNIIDVEPELSTLKFTIDITPEQIANAAISDKNLTAKLTGEFGDFEGMNPQQLKQEIINDPSDIFTDMLFEYRNNYGHGYTLDFEYYKKPTIIIDTPINFEEFNSINNIMDFLKKK